jgi:hypothetical protein
VPADQRCERWRLGDGAFLNGGASQVAAEHRLRLGEGRFGLIQGIRRLIKFLPASVPTRNYLHKTTGG